MGYERAADRTEHAQLLPHCVAGESVQPGTERLVEHLDPPGARLRPHDRQRPAHRDGGIAGDVRETARLRVGRAARRGDAQHELLRVVGELRNDARPFEEDGAAGAGSHLGHAPPAREVSTSASTAMRTATPLRTWSRMTDCGPSATSEAISMPRFMWCGCITMASGRARPRRSRVSPQAAKYAAPSGRSPWPMRSFWMRSIMTTSAPLSPGASCVWRAQPANSSRSGMRT